MILEHVEKLAQTKIPVKRLEAVEVRFRCICELFADVQIFELTMSLLDLSKNRGDVRVVYWLVSLRLL